VAAPFPVGLNAAGDIGATQAAGGPTTRAMVTAAGFEAALQDARFAEQGKLATNSPVIDGAVIATTGTSARPVTGGAHLHGPR
jgi:hypothetical protein